MMMKAYLQLQELAPNQSEWFDMEAPTSPPPSDTREYTEMLGYMYQWKEKRPHNKYRILLVQECSLAETD